MTETPDQNAEAPQAAPLDLSELRNLDFTSNWGESPKPSRESRSSARPARKEHGRSHPPRDRRPSGARREGEKHGGARRPADSKPFRPIVEALFYPEDTPFTALVNALRTSCKTYQLFEIAQLILEKPDRFVVVINPKKGNSEGVEKFFCSVPDHMPFLSEEEAIAHVMRTHVEAFFDVEVIESEPPKGSFPFVNRCKHTGDIIGPPNFHRYQQMLHEHYALHGSGMSFEAFERQLERVDDPEIIQSWTDSMAKVRHYRLKNRAEGEPESFDNLESARYFLVTHRKGKVVREVNTARFSGTAIESMPRGSLRRSIETELEYQRKFPLQTSNNLRGRMRRLKFNLFKKGAKGPAYVCAVKRRFRDTSTVFSESIQALVSFIDQNPDIPIAELQTRYLGFPEKGEGDAAVPVLTPEQQAQSKQLIQDLRWLIVEGYVTEFSDGKLCAAPTYEQRSPEEEASVAAEAHEEHADPAELETYEPVPSQDEEASHKAEA